MKNISNKTIFILVLLAIIISLGGTWLSLSKLQMIGITGKAPIPITQGTATFTSQENMVINVTQASVDWGTVQVGAGNATCSVNSETGTYYRCSNCTGTACNTVNSSLLVTNIGNVYVNITVSAGKAPEDFIGGSTGVGPLYLWKCRNGSGISAGEECNSEFTGGNDPLFYQDVEAGTNTFVTGLIYSNDTDPHSFYLDVNLTIPRDAVGTKTDTITFTAVYGSQP
jgi:hypothetical protein